MQDKAVLARLAYLSPSERQAEAQRLGYTIESQDADRVLLSNPEGQAVISVRGTDLKNPKNVVRDVATDVAILFGKGEKTPRYMATQKLFEEAIQSGKYKNIEAVGHSLGGHQAIHLGKTYGIKTHAFNPAFSLPDVARSFIDRLAVRQKHKNINIYTTATDPISVASMLSLTANVRRHKPLKHGLSSHSLEQFINH